MAKFKVQEYKVCIRTYEIEADTVSKAVSRINESTPIVSEECIGLLEYEGKVTMRINPTWYLYDRNWVRALRIMPTLRTVENVETGERWDRWDGYWPPTSASGERG